MVDEWHELSNHVVGVELLMSFERRLEDFMDGNDKKKIANYISLTETQKLVFAGVITY